MFDRAVDYYRRLNRPGKTEDSASFRVAVAMTVLLSVYAAARYGEVGLPMAAVVFAAVIAGSYFSYRMRNRNNLIVKFVLTILLLVAFSFFWTELSGSLYDLRYPLVKLFLWLQALHSFDLPARRDLDFSLISSTILIAFAGSLSLSSDFLYLLVPFFITGLAALYLGHISSLRSASNVYVRGRGSGARRAIAVALLLLIPVTVALFVALPRLPGFSAYYLPMTWLKNFLGEFQGSIKNPGYEKIPEEFPSAPFTANPNSYHGFNTFLDLRVRGVPSDATVMKVRSTQPAYWRATSFDYFRGNGWMNTDNDPEQIYSNRLPIPVNYPKGQAGYPTRELVQTFFIESKLPNTLFAAYSPRDVYFPTRVIKVDSMTSVLVPVTLNDGLIYTVTSEVSSATPDMLRKASDIFPAGVKKRFCQLPEMSPEVAALASSITKEKETQYDKVEALSEYLKRNYTYDLDVAPQGNDENTVEFFLFDQKRGFCEHFATALAVMCRTQGIPTRLTVGYDTGTTNPLTGYYEVSGRDAHAWVEVFFPLFGWIQFDPTPGWSDPSPRAGGSTWSGFSLFEYVGKGLSRIFPTSWARALKNAALATGRGVKSAAAAVADRWRGMLLVLGLAAFGLAVFLFVRRRRRAPPGRETGPSGPRRKAWLMFERMCDALASVGLRRLPSQTPVEFALAAESRLKLPGVSEAARIFSAARYSASGPTDEELARLDGVVRRVESSLLPDGLNGVDRPGSGQRPG